MAAQTQANHTSVADTPKTQKPILNPSTGHVKSKKPGNPEGENPLQKNSHSKGWNPPIGPIKRAPLGPNGNIKRGESPPVVLHSSPNQSTVSGVKPPSPLNSLLQQS